MRFSSHDNFCNGQAGQALVETLFSFLLLFLSLFVVLEVTRLVAYKTLLQTLTSAAAKRISYSHLELLDRGIVSREKGTFELNHPKFRDQISDQISKDLHQMGSVLLSFDQKNATGDSQGVLYLNKSVADLSIQFVNQSDQNSKLQSGVYIKVNSCLPVLFSSYFRNMAKDQAVDMGKKIGSQDQNRNCLGEFSASNWEPLFWFRVRAASYAPWPASSEIYLKGYAIPKKLYGLEDDSRQDVVRRILELNPMRFFSNGAK